MYYSFELKELPEIDNFYTITRDTVWQISDKSNILIYVKSGSCKIILVEEEYTLNKGDVFYIPAECEYKRIPVDNTVCTMVYIHFSINSQIECEEFENLKEEILKYKEQLDNEILVGDLKLSYKNRIYIQNKNTIKDTEKIEEYIKGINMFSDKRQLMCNLQSSVSLCRLLLKLSSSAVETILKGNSLREVTIVHANLKKAISYIARHYKKPITLDDLAKYCNISKQQLIRYFKNSLNTTPIKYITEYKVFRAKEMLFTYPQLTVKEISEELGFDNQHYFSRIFMKTTGQTPTEFRKTIEKMNKE